MLKRFKLNRKNKIKISLNITHLNDFFLRLFFFLPSSHDPRFGFKVHQFFVSFYCMRFLSAYALLSVAFGSFNHSTEPHSTLIRQILIRFYQTSNFRSNSNTHSHHSKHERQMNGNTSFVFFTSSPSSTRHCDCSITIAKIRRLVRSLNFSI